jgi:hypothetical protein
VIHKNPSRHLRRDAEEMRPILPRDMALFQKPEVRFMDERGRLQRVTAALATQLGCSPAPEVLIQEGDQFVGRFALTFAPRAQ